MSVLRSPRVEDADALYPLLVGSVVVETLLWDGPTSFDTYREKWGETVDAAARGERHFFVIVNASGAPVGSADLRPMSGVGLGAPFRADIGLWVGLPHHGQGIGTETVRALVAYGFEKLALDKIEASVFVGNIASRRIFEEGTIRNAVRKRGRLLDEWLFGIVRC